MNVDKLSSFCISIDTSRAKTKDETSILRHSTCVGKEDLLREIIRRSGYYPAYTIRWDPMLNYPGPMVGGVGST